MDHIRSIVEASREAMRRAQLDMLREMENMHGAAAGRGVGPMTEDEELQLALAMSEQLEHERVDREFDREESTAEINYPPHDWTHLGAAPPPAAPSSFERKIVDTSDLRSSSELATDELLARQLQNEEEAEAAAVGHQTTGNTVPPPSSAPLPITPAHFDQRWGPPSGPLPIITSPQSWVPPSPGPRPFFGGLTDNQLAREIQTEEDFMILAANEQPAHYRPPARFLPDDAEAGQGPTSMLDVEQQHQYQQEEDELARAMEESIREAQDQERRELREQQEREYEETLLMDQMHEREREAEANLKRSQEETERRQRLDEEDKREQRDAEHEAQLYSLVLKRDSEIARLQQLVGSTQQEATEGEAANGGRKLCALVIRLANGTRLEHKFWGNNTLLDVKHWVDLQQLEAAKREDEERPPVCRKKQRVEGNGCNGRGDSRGEESQAEEEDGELQFQLGRYMPRNYYFVTTYPQNKLTNWNLTLEQAGLCPRALVNMQEEPAH